jgi:hypothetical protein
MTDVVKLAVSVNYVTVASQRVIPGGNYTLLLSHLEPHNLQQRVCRVCMKRVLYIALDNKESSGDPQTAPRAWSVVSSRRRGQGVAARPRRILRRLQARFQRHDGRYLVLAIHISNPH